MFKYTIETVVFIGGAVIMILELVGSRILAPYIGTSIYVWTSLIGVVLGSLSIGYWWGGRLADKKQSYVTLAAILFIAAIFIGVVAFFNSFLLSYLLPTSLDIRSKALIATLILFGPPSVFLGAILPYAVRLKMKSVATSGRTVGKLYAFSTIGSILGTFIAGFFLIAYIGTTNSLLLLAASMVVISLLVTLQRFIFSRLLVLMLLLASIIGFQYFYNHQKEEGFVDVDTPYSRVWVFDATDGDTKRPVRNMFVDGEIDSAMFLDGEDLAIEYTKFYDLARHFKPDVNYSLMIGGGGYSYPKYFLKFYPEAKIDVVEIDPELTELSYKYFNLPQSNRLIIYHEDGRTFLNKNGKTYDALFLDAFNSYSVPYQLTTREAVNRIYESLEKDGVVIVNIISSIGGKKGKFLRAEYLTFKEQFPQVYLFPVQKRSDTTEQNIMLVALKSGEKPRFSSSDPAINEMLSHLWRGEIIYDAPILIDDYAPVEQYVAEFLLNRSD